MSPELLPFEAQRAWLERALQRDDDARDALRAVARWRDPEPFALAVSALVAGRRADHVADALLDALAAADDTALLRALRRLDALALPRDATEPFARLALRASAAMPVARLEARCLVERWLRRGGFAWRADDGALVACTGAELALLAARDATSRTRVEALGVEVLEVLSRAPRSLSQAHAEELLAARVYTAATHFLDELVQNADDAGAREVTVALRGHELVFTHDGAPFAPRDVVGVLSVGQSTKGRGDIGTFGVGFKSVYAVCDRPRVYSGPFAFEIADTSRPRPLAGRPEGLAPAHTAVVLPLRDPSHPARGVEAVRRRALALPAELLLTLRHVRALAVTPGRALRCAELDDDTARLDDDGDVRRYVTARRGDARVIVRVDDAGHAVPTPEGHPTLWAFLPTLERTGLRVVAQGPFVVPVDRERVDLAHSTNAALLGDVADAFADALARVPGRWFDVAPLPDALTHPALRALSARVADALQTRPVLRAHDGAPAAPARCCTLDDEALALALAGFELTPDGRRPLPQRASPVLRWLRVPPVGPEGLCAWIARDHPPAPDAPLRAALRAALAAVASARDAPAWLRDVPAALDDDGARARPDALSRGDATMRGLYRGVRPLLDAALDPLVDARCPGPLARLWDALGAAVLTPARLRDDLADATLRAALLRDDGGARVLAAAASWDDASVRGLGALPVVPCEDGAHRALAGDDAAWLRPEGPLGRLLTDTGALPLVRDDVALAHGATLVRAGARVADLDALREACEAGRARLDDEALRALWGCLSALRDALSPAAWRGVARGRWFLDRAGTPRPLAGDDAALRPHDDDVVALAPEAPWLHPDVLAAPFLAAVPESVAPAVGVRAVARALAGDDSPLAPFADEAFAHRALAWLAARPASLDAHDRDALARAPRWRDLDGHVRPLAALRAPAELDALARLYDAWRPAPQLDATSWRLARALGLDDVPRRCDPDALLDDLAAHDPTRWPARELVAAAVRASSRGASEAWRARAAGVAMLRAEDGAMARANELHRAQAEGVRALLGALGARLLDASEEALWGRALEALGPFADTPAFVRERVLAALREGATPEAWPAWLRAPGAFEALAAALGDAWRDLPVARNARDELRAPPLFDATPDARALCEATSLARALAHPDFARTAAPAMLAALPLRRVAASLEEDARAPRPVDDHPRWRDPARRSALYAWLEAHAQGLVDDPEARASLGRACVFPSRGGVLRAPGDFLHEESPPEVALDGCVAEEVPAGVRRWLAATWSLDAARLTALARHLVEAFTRAVTAGDDAAADRALAWLARAVRTPEALASLRGLALHRALTAAAHGEGRLPPRKLVDAGPEGRALVAAFADVPLLAARYDDDAAVRSFLRMLGAPTAVPVERLRALLEGDGPGAAWEARLALARYVSAQAHARPSLRHELDLDRRPWVPDDAGGWRPPAALLWPSTELDALVGSAPGRRVHQAFVITAPPGLARWLPFAHADGLGLADLVAAAGEGALSDAALAWIERALAAGRLAPAELRRALAGRRLLPDDDGAPCDVAELALAHEGRGRFAAQAARWPRLAEALRVPDARAPREAPTTKDRAAEAPAETPSEAPVAAMHTAARDEAAQGLVGRFRRWLRGDDAPAVTTAPDEAPARVTAPAPRAATSARPANAPRPWYAPDDALDPQADDATAWVADRARASAWGFVFVPRALPAPYVYAPKTLASRFERATQRWRSDDACDPAWRAPGPATGARVAFRGRVPAGQGLVLPTPLYGAPGGAAGEGVVERDVAGALRWRGARDAEVEFTVTLGGAPVFEARDEAVDAPAELTARTCPDDELPAETLAFVDAVSASGGASLERALAVRDFVRAHYRYDPSALEDASVGRFLAGVRAGRAHGALAALHAGRTARHLGAGVCYELNALACELLRRVDVPAAVCAGWVLDDGAATEPDHLWAMALVPTARGPRWMPVDAASTREGRPLRVPRRPAPTGVRAPPQPPLPPGGMPATPAWAVGDDAPTTRDEGRGVMPQRELARVARWVEVATGERPASEAALRRACRALLADPARARALLAMLRGEGAP